jgi:hypothetical protein
MVRVVLLTLLMAGLAGRDARAQGLNAEGIQPNEVKRGVAVENAKVDLTMCASDLDVLQGADESAAIADMVHNPQCRAAILRAQSLGMTRAQIVATLMGASGVANPNPGGPPPAANPAGAAGAGGSAPH